METLYLWARILGPSPSLGLKSIALPYVITFDLQVALLTAFVKFGDYVFFNASLAGISPLDGFTQYIANNSLPTKINFAQGCELWSNDQSGFPDAVEAAKSSDVAIVMVNAGF